MTYEVITTSGELYHHGIEGQKWGVQNGPPYPLSAADHKKVAKSAQKELNKIDKKLGQARYSQKQAALRENKAKTMGNKEQAKWEKQKKEEYEKTIKEGEAETRRILKELQKSGYEVTTKDLKRAVIAEGEDKATLMKAEIVGGVLFGIPGYIVAGSAYTPTESGTKYKVR